VPRDKKQRIPVEVSPELRTNPFAALDLQGRDLPPGGTGVCHGAISVPRSRDSGSPVTKQSTPQKEKLLLRRSTAHRAGKTVLILEGFSPVWSAVQLEALLHELKATLGCGGKIEARHLELQGELTDRLLPLLEARGFAVKRGW
jgi:translation initiation factor 1 (eIF-1/SUI1)